MKTLSLLIPVYNTETYLRRCLDSVLLEEVLDSLELILVNDGSTDGSGAILRAYQRRCPDTVRYLEQENGGHGSAINTGLRAATGTYFRVLDSDDWFDSPAFLRFMRLLPSCREDLIVTPCTRELCADGTEIAVDYPFLTHNTVYRIDELAFRPGMNYFTMASSCYRTSLLRDCGLHLDEHCSYVDMQYNFFPIPSVRSLRYLDCGLYRYYIGRQEQSMAPEKLLRGIPMHQQVLCSLIDRYARVKSSLSPNLRRYCLLIIRYMYETHATLLCIERKDRLAAYRAVKELEARIRRDEPELYACTDDIACLRLSRRVGYLNVLVFSRRTAALLTGLLRRLGI